MPKTATTCMQAHLFGQHSNIEYLGKYEGEGQTRGHWADAAVQALKDNLGTPNPSVLTQECCSKIADRVALAIAGGRIPVWSREGQTGGKYEKKLAQARLFRTAFGTCKVIIFVRRPDRFLESMYLQALKGFQKAKSKPPAWGSNLGPPPRFIGIETWLEANWNLNPEGMTGHMLCADTASAYAEAFGGENVRLFVFEQFVENPQTVIRDMCRFMGIDGEEGVRLMEGKRANDRWTVGQIERLKALEKSPDNAREFRAGGWVVRRRLLGLDEENRPIEDGPKARAVVPPEWLERILRVVRVDHRRLVDTWGLPLEQYGYSLGESSSPHVSSRAA